MALPGGGRFYVGKLADVFESTESFLHISQLNVWRRVLNVDAVNAMSAGQANIQATLARWKDLKHSVVGAVQIKHGTELFLPGKHL